MLYPKRVKVQIHFTLCNVKSFILGIKKEDKFGMKKKTWPILFLILFVSAGVKGKVPWDFLFQIF